MELVPRSSTLHNVAYNATTSVHESVKSSKYFLHCTLPKHRSSSHSSRPHVPSVHSGTPNSPQPC